MYPRKFVLPILHPLLLLLLLLPLLLLMLLLLLLLLLLLSLLLLLLMLLPLLLMLLTLLLLMLVLVLPYSREAIFIAAETLANTFGFQDDNVRNQVEHLLTLLANHRRYANEMPALSLG